jgi:hypothetical protein
MPELMGSESYDIYKPKVLVDEKFEHQGKLITQKRVEYLIVPKKSGEIVLKPEFIIFDVKTGKYTDLMPDELKLEVSPKVSENVEIAQSNKEKPKVGLIPEYIYIGGGIGILAIASLFFLLYFRRQKSDINHVYDIKDSLEDQLKILEGNIENGTDTRRFTEEAYKILCSYLLDRKIDHYIEKTELINKMSGKFDNQLENQINNFAAMAEMAIFAKHCTHTKSEIFSQLKNIMDQININHHE